MYSRIYTGGGDGVRVPPDYSGNAIKIHPPVPPPAPHPSKQKPQMPEPPCPIPPEPQKPESPSPESPCDCEKPEQCEKSGGHLLKLLSGVSADDLIIYGIIIYMTLQDTDSDIMLLALLLVVLL